MPPLRPRKILAAGPVLLGEAGAIGSESPSAAGYDSQETPASRVSIFARPARASVWPVKFVKDLRVRLAGFCARKQLESCTRVFFLQTEGLQ